VCWSFAIRQLVIIKPAKATGSQLGETTLLCTAPGKRKYCPRYVQDRSCAVSRDPPLAVPPTPFFLLQE